MKKICIVFCLLLSFSQVWAQKFKITEIETDTFPRIKVIIEWLGSELPLESEFEIVDEYGTSLKPQLYALNTSNDSYSGRRSILFVIDASAYTDGFPIGNFKRGVQESFDLLSNRDMINVAYVSKTSDPDRIVTKLSPEFNSNFSRFSNSIDQRITSSIEDSLAPDLFKAINEGLDILSEITEGDQKLLIFISGAISIEDSRYDVDKLVKKAKKNNIQIYTINYKINNQFSTLDYKDISDYSGGKSEKVTNSTDIKNAIGNFLEGRTSDESDISVQQYALVFSAEHPVDNKPHQFKIIYQQDPPEFGNYTLDETGPAKEGGSFLSSYGIIIIIGLAAVLGFIYWQYNEMKVRRLEEEEAEAEYRAQLEAENNMKSQENSNLMRDLQEKNFRLQEQLRAKEQELAKKMDEIPTVVSPNKFDLKNTIIAGGGGAPTLMVSAGYFSENFRLNKPTITLGRSTNNDITIPEQTVSSHHATITIENSSFFLNDLDSTNGTFVNGTRVKHALLKSGDIIKLGAANCKFEL